MRSALRASLAGLLLVFVPGFARAQPISKTAQVRHSSGGGNGYKYATADVRYRFINCYGDVVMNYALVSSSRQLSPTYVHNGLERSIPAGVRTLTGWTPRFVGQVVGDGWTVPFDISDISTRGGAGCLGNTITIGKSRDLLANVPANQQDEYMNRRWSVSTEDGGPIPDRAVERAFEDLARTQERQQQEAQTAAAQRLPTPPSPYGTPRTASPSPPAGSSAGRSTGAGSAGTVAGSRTTTASPATTSRPPTAAERAAAQEEANRAARAREAARQDSIRLAFEAQQAAAAEAQRQREAQAEALAAAGVGAAVATFGLAQQIGAAFGGTWSSNSYVGNFDAINEYGIGLSGKYIYWDMGVITGKYDEDYVEEQADEHYNYLPDTEYGGFIHAGVVLDVAEMFLNNSLSVRGSLGPTIGYNWGFLGDESISSMTYGLAFGVGVVKTRFFFGDKSGLGLSLHIRTR